jgi:hypothetical protein
MSELLEANVKDFALKLDGNVVTHWHFRFGTCDDFMYTLARFKEMIPVSDRKPYPDRKWLWEVKADEAHNFRVMNEIFDNFVMAEEEARERTNVN